jgi:LmbE family N-acetylglucosaminyl deacetylase
MSETTPERALVVMAHPDEVEHFVAGTVATWRAGGTEVAYVILTAGEKGSQDPTMTAQRLIATRQDEQREAAALLGVEQITFVGEPDGELAVTRELERRVTAEIRRFRPDAIIFPDPLGYFHHPQESHPDLFAAGHVTLNAVTTTAGNRMFYPDLLGEGLEPHSCKHLWMTSAVEPNRWIDITPYMQLKIDALCCNRTQVPDPAALAVRLRRLNEAVAQYGRTVYREAFRYIRLD